MSLPHSSGIGAAKWYDWYDPSRDAVADSGTNHGNLSSNHSTVIFLGGGWLEKYPLLSSAPWQAGKSPVTEWSFLYFLPGNHRSLSISFYGPWLPASHGADDTGGL